MDRSQIKHGSLIVVASRFSGNPIPVIVTDIPEHDPSLLGVAKSRKSDKIRWIRRVDVLDIVAL